MKAGAVPSSPCEDAAGSLSAAESPTLATPDGRALSGRDMNLRSLSVRRRWRSRPESWMARSRGRSKQREAMGARSNLRTPGTPPVAVRLPLQLNAAPCGP